MGQTPETVRGGIPFWLVVFDKGEPDRIVNVEGSRFTIGRGEDCDLVLDDSLVSKEHAIITPGAVGRRRLIDLDSTNGTRLNGRPLEPPLGFRVNDERAAELVGEEWLQFGETVVLATYRPPETFGPAALAQMHSHGLHQTKGQESTSPEDPP